VRHCEVGALSKYRPRHDPDLEIAKWLPQFLSPDLVCDAIIVDIGDNIVDSFVISSVPCPCCAGTSLLYPSGTISLGYLATASRGAVIYHHNLITFV
jgi:hypothetical protein